MVNPLSLITTPIELCSNGNPVSGGTGFYYSSTWDEVTGTFLVTNYHVLTGNNPTQRTSTPIGDSIVFYYHMDKDDPKPVVGIEIPLFTNSGKQIWIDHSNSVVDIALIPMFFSLPVKPEWQTVGKNFEDPTIDVSPSDPVTLIGYPRMYFDKKNALPIYKTGSVASEYSYDFDGDPCFIIDVSAFAGNSGSPVFSIQKNAQIITEQILIKAPGSIVKFLGVYSAGIEIVESFPIQQIKSKKEGIILNLDMQLGIVWKDYLIEEIIKQHSYKEYEKVAQELLQKKQFHYKISRGLNLL
ncbi:MAG: serine protease [Patescibacteria group bacterium]